MEILQNPRKGHKKEEARRGQEEARRGPEEARKRPEEARKRPGEAPKGQDSRIWRKTIRNAMFYEQKMTSLGAPEFWRFWLEEASKRPRTGRRGQEEARRGQEEARKRPGRGQKGTKGQECRIWRKN